MEVLCFPPSWLFFFFFFYEFDLRATHARTLLPAALTSVSCGFVLVWVRVLKKKTEASWVFLVTEFEFESSVVLPVKWPCGWLLLWHRPRGGGNRRLTGRGIIKTLLLLMLHLDMRIFAIFRCILVPLCCSCKAENHLNQLFQRLHRGDLKSIIRFRLWKMRT